MKGIRIGSRNSVNEVIIHLLDQGLRKGILGMALVPSEVPAGDMFAYLMVKEPDLLAKVCPVPPVMAVQGGRVLRSVTMYGPTPKRSAAAMRPCEARAAVELHNLRQANLENTLLITFDCPGALSLSAYVKAPAELKETFEKAQVKWDSEPMRPVCKVCTEFSAGPADLHVAWLGMSDSPVVVPLSQKGQDFVESLGLKADVSVEDWQRAVAQLREERLKAREDALRRWSESFSGVENLLKTLAACVNCHNCERACPICYCRQCYFDSEALKLSPTNYLRRAKRKGALRFPPDTLLFHLGRMSHMVLSCVSCGACEDACPMDIPVAQLFSLVGAQAQRSFGYRPGAELGQRVPLVEYRPEEFQEVETPYLEMYKASEAKNV